MHWMRNPWKGAQITEIWFLVINTTMVKISPTFLYTIDISTLLTIHLFTQSSRSSQSLFSHSKSGNFIHRTEYSKRLNQKMRHPKKYVPKTKEVFSGTSRRTSTRKRERERHINRKLLYTEWIFYTQRFISRKLASTNTAWLRELRGNR